MIGGASSAQEGTGSNRPVAALLAACHTKAAAYAPREIEFLRSIAPIAVHRLTDRQIEWLAALADREPLDFAAINRNALAHLTPICRRWLPDGSVRGHEFVARNPIRHDKNAGSFRVNLVTGKWADFAQADARGGDPISLAAYLHHGGDQIAAALALKSMVSA